MDSFYDAPRRPPQPIPQETFPATPVVPEISVLCPSNTPKNAFTPYNQWKKDTMPNNYLVFNKENINSQFQNTSILKKQVRFESPALQQRLLRGNEHIINKIGQNPVMNPTEIATNHAPHNQARVVPNFEQMYMANIPNRQLDLSVIDLPKREPQNEGAIVQIEGKNVQDREREQPRTYREFLERHKVENHVILNDSVTDIFNYKRNTPKKNPFTPKVEDSTYKIGMESGKKNFRGQVSPVINSNICETSAKDVKYGLSNDNHRKNELKEENLFNRVTEAISQRNIPAVCEKQYTKGGQEYKGPENHIIPESGFISQNNHRDGIQSKLLFADIRNKSRAIAINCEDIQRKAGIEIGGVENKKNNSVRFKTQTHTGSTAVPLTVSHNLISTEHCKTPRFPTNFQNKCECFTQTGNDLDILENNALKKKNDDFSVKDLLKIMAQQSQQMVQQNEQILLLQRQVSELISQRKESECCPKQKSIHYRQEKNCCQQDKICCDQPTYYCTSQEKFCDQKQVFMPGLMSKDMENIQDRCITSTQHENCDSFRKKLEGTPKKNKNNMPNFSIGLTTSFEVSFRRPHCNRSQNDFLQKNNDLPGFEQYNHPKIQELTETNSTESNDNFRRNEQEFCQKLDNDNNRTLVDESIIFKEPIRVREPCPSPEPSIKINMNDFEDSETETEETSEIGASFYRNLMVQVNKILQKAQIETAQEMAYNFKGPNLRSNTLNKVKEVTLKHLRRIGVDIHNCEDHSESSSSSDGMDSKSYDQEDISFAVKQLLMKYLPADHLAKIAYKEAQIDNFALLTPKDKIGAIKTRPDFSFATVQYMKKYNLIANNHKDFPQVVKKKQPESPKILDITKLKQQPKLL